MIKKELYCFLKNNFAFQNQFSNSDIRNAKTFLTEFKFKDANLNSKTYI